jgi:DNA-binding HxlR family transcriptional regulator
VIDDVLDDLVEDGVVTRDGHEYRLET